MPGLTSRSFDLIFAGNVTQGLEETYTSVFGVTIVDGTTMFWMILYVSLIAILYITTQDIAIPSQIALVVGWALAYSNRLGPNANLLGFIIAMFGLASILYKIRSVRRVG